MFPLIILPASPNCPYTNAFINFSTSNPFPTVTQYFILISPPTFLTSALFTEYIIQKRLMIQEGNNFLKWIRRICFSSREPIGGVWWSMLSACASGKEKKPHLCLSLQEAATRSPPSLRAVTVCRMSALCNKGPINPPWRHVKKRITCFPNYHSKKTVCNKLSEISNRGKK